MSLIATLMHPVVLAHGRTPVRVVARGVGLLRVGDVTRLVLGSFDEVLWVRSAPRIEVRFGLARRTIDAVVVAAPAPPGMAVACVTVAPAFHLPRSSFDVAVRLYQEEPRD